MPSRNGRSLTQLHGSSVAPAGVQAIVAHSQTNARQTHQQQQHRADPAQALSISSRRRMRALPTFEANSIQLRSSSSICPLAR